MSDVQEGYKMSKVGVIPVEWEVKSLGDCLLKKPEYGINAAAVPYSDNLPVYIRITDISDDGKFLPAGKTSVNNIDSNKFLLEKNDIVFARTGASTGKTYLYSSNDGELVFAGFLIRVKVNPNKLIASYLKSYTETGTYWNWVKIMSMRSGQPGINGNEYAQLQIPLPPLPEQQAIASALNDVDALITALEQLITKKRNIKQGAMQQLLIGEKRLPGFGGAWKVVNIAENSILKARIGWQGLTTAEYLKNGEYYLITGTDFIEGKINWSGCHFIDENRYIQDKNIQLRNDDVLITKDGTIGKVGYVDNLPGKATLNSGVFVIRPRNKSYFPLFFYYVLKSNIFDTFMKQLRAGSTISHLYQKDFVDFSFSVPSLSEQQAIAKILSDMDTEIEALEQKRDKYKAIKQGMMQELLTGERRLA